MWVGGEGGMEEGLVRRQGIPFQAIPAAGVHGVGWRALPQNLIRLTRGYLAARRILQVFQPQVLFFTGGYLAGPVAWAGRHIPMLLYVPDIEPALAARLVSRLADCIAITTSDSRRYFRRGAPLVETGYPVRASLLTWSRKAARAHLGVTDERPVVLVTGGSRGARSINQAVFRHLSDLLEWTQVIHVTGELDWPTAQQVTTTLAEPLRQRYRVFPYLHEEMGAALAAADVVVSRAGASTLGEYPLFGLPAILVPYPYAWRYQKVNAEYLAARGAAVVIEDSALADQLPAVLRAILDVPARRQAMQAAMRSLAQPGAAQRIAQSLIELAGEVERC